MAMLAHCFIYAMLGLDSGLVKIGHSWNPRARLRDIARIVEPVELLASVPGPERLEYELHRRFEAHRDAVRGREWFRNEGGVAAWLAALPAEHRASGVHRVRRRAPHYTPEQADAMRRYLYSHSGPRHDQHRTTYWRKHGHEFVPGTYLEGCSACRILACCDVAPARTLGAAVRVTTREAIDAALASEAA